MREKVRETLVSLLLLLTCQAVLPPMVLAQPNKKVTLNLVQVPIKDFFIAVKAQTGLNFIMKSSNKTNQRITVNVKDAHDVHSGEICRDAGKARREANNKKCERFREMANATFLHITAYNTQFCQQKNPLTNKKSADF